VSSGAYNVPQTATVVGQFPSASAHYLTGFAYEQEGNQFLTDSVGIPMTAPAKDATFPQFQQQQQAHLMLLQAQAQAQALQNSVVAGQGGVPYGLQSVVTPDQQALHLQLEVYKMQAMHQQQLQAQIFHEAQRQMLYQHQHQQPSPSRRRPSEPVTSGPLTTSFGPQLRNRTPSGANEGSATAGLDGRFPAPKPGLNPHAHSFHSGINETPVGNAAVSSNWRSADRPNLPAPPVTASDPAADGGTLLGASITAQAPSARHTAATSWRRPPLVKAEDGESSASPPSAGSPSASPPAVYVSTPEETSPTQSRCESPSAHRPRPQPLRFTVPPTIPDQVETDEVDGQILPWLRTNDTPSSPATPSSVSSVHSAAREEATRRLYEGLGVGRPSQPAIHADPVRHVSQPARQPRGPPSGVEELGARNFASRIRRKAIGGLGALMDARGRRSSMIEVEAY